MDVVFLGLSKAGKTSIIRTLTSKCQPNYQAIFETTQKVEKSELTIAGNLINIYDFYGTFQIENAKPEEKEYLKKCTSIVYIIDGQNETYEEAVNYFEKLFAEIVQINPKCNYHFFVHKIDNDGFATLDKKTAIISQIKGQLIDYFNSYQNINPNYDINMTNWQDQTLSEAFSKVIQKVIPQVSYIASLLTSLVTNSKMEKAFLFDQVNKLYIATDAGPFDQNTYQMCFEMIDVFLDISFIYDPNDNGQIKNSEGSLSIKLSDNTVLLMKSFKEYLCLICIIKQENYVRPFIIDYNIEEFCKGLEEMIKVTK
ncbi:hypothetical protein ABPG72_007929 [Tetrahymena utriculariae]